MKINRQNPILTLLSILLFCIQVNAQTHKSNHNASGEGLPMNRAAFLACYNSISYKNPKEQVTNNKTNVTATSAVSKTINKISEEDISFSSNITEDELWVQLNNKKAAGSNLNVEIYNASGEIVYYSRIIKNLHRINVCDFTAGTFLVKTGDIVKKLVIE